METTEKTVAMTILSQLGGNKFRAMTGAKYFVSSENTLTFSFGGNRKMNKCRITLTAMDDYTMEFYQLRARECKLIETSEGVYNDNLQEVFKSVTGLDTHL